MTVPITPANVQVPGDLDAPLIVDFDIHALRMALVEKNSVLKLGTPWSTPGVYVLLGSLGDGKPTDVYVGTAVKLKERLTTHRTKPKIAWWRAVAVARDTTAGFNSAEIGYLEGRIASELKALPSINLVADRYDLDTTLPPHMLIQLDAFVPTILAALRLAGLDLRSAPEPGEPDETVHAGKQFIPGSIADLLSAGLLKAGAALVFTRKGYSVEGSVTADGQILVDGKAYTSPSAAAIAAMPHLKAVNGWASWRTTDGTTIAALRAQLPPSA